MTDILCNWLNNELQLSVRIDAMNFANEFATGYLIGEVLDKHQLLTDFEFYSQSRTADSKLNNFTRMEPVLHLLGVNFDTNVARDIMTEKPGTVTRVLYQLYISLNKKEKSKLTGVAMETMRPSAPVKLEKVESLMYKERLKHMTPRQTDLSLEAVVSKFHDKQIKLEETAFRDRFLEEQRYEEMLQQKREELINKYKDTVARRSEMLARIQAAKVEIPRTPPSKSAAAIQIRRQQRRQQEAQDMRKELASFDDRLKRTLPPSKPLGDDEAAEARDAASNQMPSSLEVLRPGDNSEYISKIRKRLNEDVQARQEREKRRRKVLVEQMRAHEAQEEAKREEMLVNRLMRQSQQERRIAVQLLQTRHEKEVIRRNRLAREKQYEHRRLNEFEQAMNKEKEMARLARIEYADQTRQDRELHDRLMAERAEERYRKHYSECAGVLGDMLDFAAKVTEYRELTNKLVPAKLYREWTALFTAGQPLYEVAEVSAVDEQEPTPEQILEEERQQLLDEGDFSEYRQMIGEWEPPEDADSKIEGPPRNNPIVGHIVQRLFDIVHPPTPPPPPPEFPPFPIKACVLGKPFAGKTTAIRKLAEFHRVQTLEVDKLVEEAIEAHNNNELLEIVEEPTPADDGRVTADDGTLLSTEPTIIDDNRTDEPTIPGPSGEETSQPAVPPAESQVVGDSNKVATESVAKSGGGGSATKAASGGNDAAASAQPAPADDGAEKTDPEKPVGDDEATAAATSVADAPELVNATPSSKSTAGSKGSKQTKKSKKSEKDGAESEKAERAKSSTKPQPSVRNKLGAKALKYLKKGKACDDQLLVDIVVDVIKRIPGDTGWVLDGFPATAFQAKLLEKALTGGGDALGRDGSKTDVKDKDGKKAGKKSKLAPDPRPAPPPPEPGSGLNVVILFDVTNETVLKRSAGRTYSMQTNEQYHEEYKPPPEGTNTGLGDDQVVPVDDPSNEQQQVQHRLNAFNHEWPRMEKWYTKSGTVMRVDASLPEESAFLEFEKILEDTVRRVEGEVLEESIAAELEEQARLEEEERLRLEAEKKAAEQPPPEAPPEEEASRSDSRKSGSRGGSPKRPGSKKSKDDTKSKAESARSKKSESSGKKSPKGKGKKGKSPDPEPEPEPEVPTGPPPPAPGSDEWVYVNEPIEEPLARALAPYWEEIETNYINSSKVVFRKVRQERERIIRYLFNIRKNFVTFLKRPDHKQEFVSDWQRDFNAVSDDIRDDEETRAEMHERVDDLRERLWTICDERKEQAEKERLAVMNEGWLEDRLGILSNDYITVLQAELDRFQDTLRLLKDYYRGMEGKIPDEQSNDYARVPLIDLPPTGDDPVQEAGDEGLDTPKSPPPDETKSTTSKSGLGKKGKGSQEDVQEKKGPRIPLVPRRPVSPDPNAAAAKTKDAKGKKPTTTTMDELPPPPTDPDEKLVYDGHCNAVISVDKMVQQEVAAREAEEAAEREREALKEAEKLKAQQAAAKGKGKDKGGKGGKKSAKSRSPSPKKRDNKSPSSETPQPEESMSEEEKHRIQELKRARQEFFASLQEEADAAKTRMTLVKLVAMRVLAALKVKADSGYKDMNDWLGARFLKEMESIDHMSEVMRHAVESGEKVKEELVLQQEDFLVNEDLKILRTPSPQPRPPPIEAVKPDFFTVDQILSIYEQFSLTAPSGVISLTGFEDTFRSLTALTHGTEQIPDMWLNISSEKLEYISKSLSPNGEYIDWRMFLLSAAQPWPRPTQDQLLVTLQRFHDMDQKETGFVTREQYERVDLWFHGLSTPQTPADPSAPYPYDRLANLHIAFFDLFAEHDMDPPSLDYVKMLMYFAGHRSGYIGLLRALSVVVGEHVPHIVIKDPKPPSRPGSQASLLDSMTRENTMTLEEAEASLYDEEVPDQALQTKVTLEQLERVLHFGQQMRGDSHRFSVQVDPEDVFSRERLEGIFNELGSDSVTPVAFTLLIEHPIVQDIIAACNIYKAVDMKLILSSVFPAEQAELQSQKTDG